MTDFEKFSLFVTNIAKMRGWKLNPDNETVTDIVNGLIAQYKKHGKPYCPCEFNTEEDLSRVCPCDNAQKDVDEKGSCNCNLYVKINCVQGAVPNGRDSK